MSPKEAPTDSQEIHDRTFGRGWGPTHETWYSACSAHRRYRTSCSTCQYGSWVNTWRQAVTHEFYERYPGLWRVLANRRHYKFDKRSWETIKHLYYVDPLTGRNPRK